MDGDPDGNTDGDTDGGTDTDGVPAREALMVGVAEAGVPGETVGGGG